MIHQKANIEKKIILFKKLLKYISLKLISFILDIIFWLRLNSLPQYGVVLILLHLHLPLRSQTSPPFIIASKVNHLFHQCTLVYSS